MTCSFPMFCGLNSQPAGHPVPSLTIPLLFVTTLGQPARRDALLTSTLQALCLDGPALCRGKLRGSLGRVELQ